MNEFRALTGRPIPGGLRHVHGALGLGLGFRLHFAWYFGIPARRPELLLHIGSRSFLQIPTPGWPCLTSATPSLRTTWTAVVIHLSWPQVGPGIHLKLHSAPVISVRSSCCPDADVRPLFFETPTFPSGRQRHTAYLQRALWPFLNCGCMRMSALADRTQSHPVDVIPSFRSASGRLTLF